MIVGELVCEVENIKNILKKEIRFFAILVPCLFKSK
jgi:hypothetical protein